MTTENNKLIAEFMGMKIITFKGNEYVNNTGTFTATTVEDLEAFQYDWNWLMEVVERIESLEIIDRKGRFSVNSICFDENYTAYITDEEKDLIQVEGETKRVATYNAVVEFIKWHNQQTR